MHFFSTARMIRCVTVMMLTLSLGGLLMATFPAVSAAQNGGNSAAAELCQGDGYQNVTRDDGSSFSNAGECVSYLAQGGALGAPGGGTDRCSAPIPPASVFMPEPQDLSGCDLSNRDLTGRNLIGANLSGANLSGSDLTGTLLADADLSGANLVGAEIDDANLINADLSWANLSGSFLTGVDFTGVNLTGADLSGSSLLGVNFTNANLAMADTTGAVFTDSIWRNTTCRDGSNSEWTINETCEGPGGSII